MMTEDLLFGAFDLRFIIFERVFLLNSHGTFFVFEGRGVLDVIGLMALKSILQV